MGVHLRNVVKVYIYVLYSLCVGYVSQPLKVRGKKGPLI